MIRPVASLATGVASALRVPLRLRGGLRPLLAEAPAPWRGEADPALALRAARLTLRLLARLPASPWRNTCLYRGVAECLVLRAHGTPAVLRIGVRAAAAPGGPVEAHAWVERSAPAADPCAPGSPGYRPLRHAAPR